MIINSNCISKSYSNRITALENIKFSVEKGENIGLVGSIGAGKTTLLRILAGLLNVTSGTLEIQVRKENIAYMPAASGLIRTLRVRDNIKIWSNAYNAAKDNIDYVIENLSLERLLDKEVKQLSSGMKTMLSFGCTVLGKPELALLDEPFVHLDLESSNKIKRVIRTFLNNSSVIISSHDLESVEELTDCSLLIKDGKQIHFDKSKGLKDRYLNIMGRGGVK